MMRSLFDWIRNLFSGNKEADLSMTQTGVRVRPPSERPGSKADQAAESPPTRERKPDLRFESDVGGRIEDAGPGKNVLVRSKYLREDSGTHEILKIIDESLETAEDDDGFDPYNTGQFDRSRNWNSRNRK